jgi:hypothetical protein
VSGPYHGSSYPCPCIMSSSSYHMSDESGKKDCITLLYSIRPILCLNVTPLENQTKVLCLYPNRIIGMTVKSNMQLTTRVHL